MKNIFRKAYEMAGRFNGAVLAYMKKLGYEFFFYVFMSGFLSMSMMIACPAFISIMMPVFLTGFAELTVRGFMIPKIQGKPSLIKGKMKDVVASIIGTGIGLLLSYAWIRIGASCFVWF